MFFFSCFVFFLFVLMQNWVSTGSTGDIPVPEEGDGYSS